MSKGIVKKTPTITKNSHPGKLQVKEVEGAGNQGLLDTEIDFLSPSFVVSEWDYVEFDLNLAGTSMATKMIHSRGIVRELNNPNNGMGRLMVTVVNPNDKGVVRGMDLWFYNYDSIPLAVDDYVEFINMSATECQAIRKIQCVGSIQLLPGANPGTIIVSKVGTNSAGVSVGSTITFPLPSPVPNPFQSFDIVEFRVVGPGAGEYVQLLSPRLQA
jgi:hypothetical protein